MAVFSGNLDSFAIERDRSGGYVLKLCGSLQCAGRPPVKLELGVPGAPMVAPELFETDAEPGAPRGGTEVWRRAFEAVLPLPERPRGGLTAYLYVTLAEGISIVGRFDSPEDLKMPEEESVPERAVQPFRFWEIDQALALERFLDSDARLSFASRPGVQLSVVVSTEHGAAPLYRSLRSLVAQQELSLQVLVIDDGRGDTAALLQRVDGVICCRVEPETGVAHRWNRAAAASASPLLLFLRSGLELLPGALSTAVAALIGSPETGVLTPRIVARTGELADAGSMLFETGAILPYGSGENPEEGEFTFRRSVDCCSEQFVLVKEHLFSLLGGFDESFSTTRYTTADLCIRAHEATRNTLYEPLVVALAPAEEPPSADARVEHFSDRARFNAKHVEHLRQRKLPREGVVLWAREHRRDEPRTLVVQSEQTSGGRGELLRAAELVHVLTSLQQKVTFLTTDEGALHRHIAPRVPATVERLNRSGEALERFFEQRAGYYRTLVVVGLKALERISTPLAVCWHDEFRLILDVEDASAEMLTKLLRSDPALAELLRSSACLITRTKAQQGALQDGGLSATVVPAVIEPMPLAFPFRRREGLLITMDAKQPELMDDLFWFLDEIYPAALARSSLMAVTVAAGFTAPLPKTGHYRNVELRPTERILPQAFDQRRIFVAPFRGAIHAAAAVVEAAARGLPIIATPQIAQELGWHDGDELLVGETAEEFAQQLQRLYSSETLWDELRQRAWRKVREQYSRVGLQTVLRQYLDADGFVDMSASARSYLTRLNR